MTPTDKVRAALEAAYWFINASEVELKEIGKSRVYFLDRFHENMPNLEALRELDGMVIVPVEPTPLQVREGVKSDDLQTGYERCRHIYAAMIAPYVKGE